MICLKTSFWIKLCLALLLMVLPVAASADFDTAADVEAWMADHPGEKVELTGDILAPETLAALLEKYPDAEFVYTLNVCGVDVSSDATELVLEGELTPEQLEEVRQKLPCLPALIKLDMFDNELPDEYMAELFEAYPDIRFGWTLHVGRWFVRTDASVFTTLKTEDSRRFKTEHFENLRYCYQLKALDLGHNAITDIGFIGELTELRILILADNKITDISPLANLKHLEYAELFMNKISDLTPLANNPNLLDLNLTYNKAKDWTPLKTCPNIERLWYGENGITKEVRKEIEAFFPNTQIIYSTGSTGYGWRNHPRYETLYYVFHAKEYLPFGEPVPEL